MVFVVQDIDLQSERQRHRKCEKKRNLVLLSKSTDRSTEQPNNQRNDLRLRAAYLRSFDFLVCTINNTFIHKYSLTGARTFYSIRLQSTNTHTQREQYQCAKSTDHKLLKHFVHLDLSVCLSSSISFLASRHKLMLSVFFPLPSECNVINIIIISSSLFLSPSVQNSCVPARVPVCLCVCQKKFVMVHVVENCFCIKYSTEFPVSSRIQFNFLLCCV